MEYRVQFKEYRARNKEGIMYGFAYRYFYRCGGRTFCQFLSNVFSLVSKVEDIFRYGLWEELV